MCVAVNLDLRENRADNVLKLQRWIPHTTAVVHHHCRLARLQFQAERNE